MPEGFLSGTTHTIDQDPNSDPLPYGDVYGKPVTTTAPDGTQIPPAQPTAAQDPTVANGTDLGNNNVPQTTEQRPEPDEENRDDIGDKYKDFDDYFRKRFDVGLEDVVTMLQDLGEFRNQQLIQQQETVLRNEWGTQFEDYMGIVREKFEKLPDAQKAAYDNVEGARRLLAEYLTYEAPQTKRMPQNFMGNVRRVPPGNQQPYDYKRSDIQRWAEKDPAKYDAEVDNITRAYQQGRVLLD